MTRRPRPTSASSAPRTCATRSGRSRRCAIGRNKMETPSLGDRDAFGLKVGAGRRRRAGLSDAARPRRRSPRARCDRRRRAGSSPWRRRRTADVLEARRARRRAPAVLRRARAAPPEVHVPVDARPDEDAEALEALAARDARRPPRAPRRAAARREARPARSGDAQRRDGVSVALRRRRDGARSTRSTRCARVLALPALPRRIECFDISTLQGRETVASMVVCVDGRMRRGEYRKFRIRGDAAPGAGRRPVAAHPRRLRRRCTRSCCAATGALLEQGGPFPDLILIDGGKGQLTAAYAALRELGLERLVAVGLAKQEELLFTRDRADGLALPRESPALRLVQRIRDEAHRFAVTFHRASRTHARSAVGARRDRRHRAAPPEAAADHVRVGRRRPPRQPRGARGGRRREGGRRGASGTFAER